MEDPSRWLQPAPVTTGGPHDSSRAYGSVHFRARERLVSGSDIASPAPEHALCTFSDSAPRFFRVPERARYALSCHQALSGSVQTKALRAHSFASAMHTVSGCARSCTHLARRTGTRTRREASCSTSTTVCMRALAYRARTYLFYHQRVTTFAARLPVPLTGNIHFRRRVLTASVQFANTPTRRGASPGPSPVSTFSLCIPLMCVLRYILSVCRAQAVTLCPRGFSACRGQSAAASDRPEVDITQLFGTFKGANATDGPRQGVAARPYSVRNWTRRTPADIYADVSARSLTPLL
ncbi:hypothetical protein FKP32DRAFT_318608 [Trametes sanguinea]|nr:hypothetical protein FKP32DRAFT_318608 [Trametes sanguinea]